MHPRAEKIQQLLTNLNLSSQVLEFSQPTTTAQDAARALNCAVAQIAKSIVFCTSTGKPVLVIASGINRIAEEKIEVEVGEKIKKADADFVLNATGFPIGGVPPIGHTQSIITFIDMDLLQYPLVWAAAGTPNAVFSLTRQELITITRGRVISVKKD